MEVKMTMEEYEFLRKRSDELMEAVAKIDNIERDLRRSQAYLSASNEQIREMLQDLDCPPDRDPLDFVSDLRSLTYTSIMVLRLDRSIEKVLFSHYIGKLEDLEKCATLDDRKLCRMIGLPIADARSVMQRFAEYKSEQASENKQE